MTFCPRTISPAACEGGFSATNASVTNQESVANEESWWHIVSVSGMPLNCWDQKPYVMTWLKSCRHRHPWDADKPVGKAKTKTSKTFFSTFQIYIMYGCNDSAMTPAMQSLFDLFTSIWLIRFISFHMCMNVFGHLYRIAMCQKYQMWNTVKFRWYASCGFLFEDVICTLMKVVYCVTEQHHNIILISLIPLNLSL